MAYLLDKWLRELEDEVSIVTSKDINEEAIQNMFAFGVNQPMLARWSEQELTQFILNCAKLYQRKCNSIDMIFYCWFDEEAGQLRISAVSQSHNKLPFGCSLNPAKLSEVINGVFCGDSGLFSKGSLDIWRCDLVSFGL